MHFLTKKKILVGICGGIAAYKSASLVRALIRCGALVRVVMTESAKAFITPMTFQALTGEVVRDTLFDADAERSMGHIELARWADYILIAPASANILAKMAHGLADDLLSTLYLVANVPVFVAPAMNHSMWAHPATQTNTQNLIKRGVHVINPEVGEQACGEYGAGRMSEEQEIIAALCLYPISGVLNGLNVVITAGPTRESIDPVRYVSNHSSGKMGYALAQAATRAGAFVTLITGPTALNPPSVAKLYCIESAADMLNKVVEIAQAHPIDIFIATAAVADYTFTQPALEKLKKQNQENLTLVLKKTTDILATVANNQWASYIVGFAAETTDVLQHAREKLMKKNIDMIFANQVGKNLGFGQDLHQGVILTQTEELVLPMMSKLELATRIISCIASAHVLKVSH